MDEKKIKDYGNTVSPQVYIDGLQGHPYIPQSDQCILNIIQKVAETAKAKFSVLDVGCGPARLTYKVARLPIQNNQLTEGIWVTGIDSSGLFLEEADKYVSDASKVFNVKNGRGQRHVKFICADFVTGEDFFRRDFISSFPKQQNVIFVQGVMHHVHGERRVLFLSRCRELLKNNGILIVGDEFIADYKNEIERKMNVAKFYLHIIAEALKGGFSDLAYEEAKNLVDDVLAGETGAGYANQEVFDLIFGSAETNNKWFYGKGFIPNQNVNDNLIPKLRIMCSKLALASEPDQSFNRGDFKISVEKFINEMKDNSFELVNTYKFGPVDELGGMGVLTFRKLKN